MKRGKPAVRKAPLLPLLVASSLLFPVGCGVSCGERTEAQRSNGEILVFAAASLTDVFSAVKDRLEEEYPAAGVAYNFAGSHFLATQIVEGAPADLLASANRYHMETVRGRGLIARSVPFATNRLVVIVPGSDPGGVRSLRGLARPGVKVVLGGPQVPVGSYAREVLGRIGLLPQVEGNVVSHEEDVKGVLGKVLLGEADAGVVYATDVAAGMDLGVIGIPDSIGVAARYWVAILEGAPNREGAEAFVAFLRSEAGMSILDAYRFGRP